jgi:TrmH family RNA methyltransferase
VIAVLRMPAVQSLGAHAGARFGLILDGLSDPGNVGTILRTADAFGAAYVVALQDCVDLFSPKVVRAGMGAHFRLPLYEDVRIEDVQATLPSTTLVASSVGDGEALPHFAWPVHTGLVIGSEAHGLSADVEELVEKRVHIPMRRGVESLNAAVAASIIMFAALGESLNIGKP